MKELDNLVEDIREKDSVGEIAGGLRAGIRDTIQHMLENHEELLENDKELAQNLITLRIASMALTEKVGMSSQEVDRARG